MIVLISFFLSFARADDSLLRVETTFQNAGNYNGSVFGASSDVGLGDGTKLFPRAQNLTRSFSGGPTINETTLTLGASQKLNSRAYLLGEASMTPNAQIASQWTAGLEPHIAIGAGDLGCRFAFAQYSTENAGLISPSYLYAFTDDLFVSESVTSVRTDRWYFSSATQVIAKPLRGLSVRVIPAFGETLESAGVPASFTSFSLELGYAISRKIRLGVGGTNYRSTLRNEQSILFRIEAL